MMSINLEGCEGVQKDYRKLLNVSQLDDMRVDGEDRRRIDS